MTEKYTMEEAQDEAEKIRSKVVSGQAENYTEAEEQVEKIWIPSKNDFEQLDYIMLHEKCEENHKKIFKFFMENNFPYFGIHGTSKESALKIENSKNNTLEMATFYEKEKNEFFLFKLYTAVNYVIQYAKVKGNHILTKDGNILIFNLEKNSKNKTIKWEHLLSRGGAEKYALDGDSDAEIEFRQKLEKTENSFFRTLGELEKNDFVGSISMTDFDYFFEKLDLDQGKIILRQRLLNQIITDKILKMIR